MIIPEEFMQCWPLETTLPAIFPLCDPEDDDTEKLKDELTSRQASYEYIVTF